MTKIDDRTYISIPLIISLVGSIIGGIVWLTSIHNIANAALSKTDSLTARYDNFAAGRENIYKSLNETNQRLANIEGKLDLLLDKTKR